ncbi:hypothetical protein TNCV_3712871 [Trichonephila clavipes]|nr:hypothetical protein TNCV_3712871 [Trichonephila clavipes]
MFYSGGPLELIEERNGDVLCSPIKAVSILVPGDDHILIRRKPDQSPQITFLRPRHTGPASKAIVFRAIFYSRFTLAVNLHSLNAVTSVTIDAKDSRKTASLLNS